MFQHSLSAQVFPPPQDLLKHNDPAAAAAKTKSKRAGKKSSCFSWPIICLVCLPLETILNRVVVDMFG
jgi:hypothetical protein